MRETPKGRKRLKPRNTVFAQALQALMCECKMTPSDFTDVINAYLSRPDREYSVSGRAHVERSWISQYLSGTLPK